MLNADYAETVPGKQLNRFCASGLEAVNTAAAQVMSGQSDLCIGGGVESMSRVPMGADGGAMASDPQVAYKTYFAPRVSARTSLPPNTVSAGRTATAMPLQVSSGRGEPGPRAISETR